MDIILRNVERTQLPLIRELAKVLGISFEQAVSADDDAQQIKAALDRVQSGTGALTTMEWEEFK